MSLHDDLDIVADFADILAYRQRAEMLATQVAQLEALRDLQHQSRLQTLRAEHERVLQDGLFALRKSLPAILNSINDEPRKVLADLYRAERIMELFPPTEFSALEWKELSSTTRDELNAVIEKLGQVHGHSIVAELSDMVVAARREEEEKRQQQAQMELMLKNAARQQQERKKSFLSAFNIAALFVIIISAFFSFWASLAAVILTYIFNSYMLSKIQEKPVKDRKP